MTSELPTLKEELIAHDLWAKKSLGQHFLLDPSITRKIATLAGDISGQAVIEVGPGPGGLTRALLAAGADPLFVIEKDARFLPLLEPLVEWSNGRLHIVHGDALEVDEPKLLDGRDAKIIANLPYNVGTPLLVKWLKAGAWRGEMLLMFQKEVAKRITAEPDDDAYGRLAVLSQAVCETEIAMTLPARAFTPPPKVDSAVVRLTPKAQPFAHLDALEKVTAAAFGQRRKMLRSSLQSLTPDAERLLAQVGIDATARAETIPVAKFLDLTRAYLAI